MKIKQATVSATAGAALTAAVALALGGCAGKPASVVGAGSAASSSATNTTTAAAGATPTVTSTGTVTSSTAGASTPAAAPTTQAQNTVSAAGDRTPACADGQLRVGIKSAGVATGHEGYVLDFTNTGSAACVVEGYPGAAVTDLPGQVVLNATRSLVGFMSEGQYPAPHPITLAPGAVAATLLEWIDMPLHGGTPDGANCPGLDGGKLLVTPPNTTRYTAFPAPYVCVGGFVVHPLIPGSSGRLL